MRALPYLWSSVDKTIGADQWPGNREFPEFPNTWLIVQLILPDNANYYGSRAAGKPPSHLVLAPCLFFRRP